jgi:hypothetical protein
VTPELAAENAAKILDRAATMHSFPEETAALVQVADGWTRLHTALATTRKTPASASGITATEELAKMSDAYSAQLAAVGRVCEVRDIQGQPGNWDVNEYQHGYYNGLELAMSILEGDRAPNFRDAPPAGYRNERSSSSRS